MLERYQRLCAESRVVGYSDYSDVVQCKGSRYSFTHRHVHHPWHHTAPRGTLSFHPTITMSAERTRSPGAGDPGRQRAGVHTTAQRASASCDICVCDCMCDSLATRESGFWYIGDFMRILVHLSQSTVLESVQRNTQDSQTECRRAALRNFSVDL